MESQTIRERLAALRQKSRRALSLYKKAFRSSDSIVYKLSEAQLREWKGVNLELYEKLTLCLEESTPKGAVARAVALRDGLHTVWRDNESLRHRRQDELKELVKNSEFVKAALLSTELVSVKAREQASKAAFDELQFALGKAKVSKESEPAKESRALPEQHVVAGPNVIPLRRRLAR